MSKNTKSVNSGAMPYTGHSNVSIRDRRHFIGGSDARIIMGKDQKVLLRLWREKRGEEASLDLSGVLIAQLGVVTEDLNRRWYELNSGNCVSDVQRHVAHRTIPWMFATPASVWVITLGAVAAMLPDPLQFAYSLFPREPLNTLQRFHGWIHAKRKLAWKLGVSSQIAFATAVSALAGTLH